MPMARPEGASWNSLTEVMPEEFLAPIDRLAPGAAELTTYGSLSENQKSWLKNGVLYLPKFLPEDMIDAYVARWYRDNFHRSPVRVGGYPYDTPYLHVEELRALSLHPPMMSVMKELIGGEMGLHLNLTGFVTTARDFHQDSYLNPEYVGSHYVAAWMALDDIDDDSGPFQFIPGSHRWPVIRQNKLFRFLTPQQRMDAAWPSFTQEWVADICLEEARRRKAFVETYLPRKGDVLLWHSQLVHRGSPAKVPGTLRPACIAHYSALSVRHDMPRRAQDKNGQWFFVFDHQHK